MTEREEITTKICLVGDSAVGKTSLIKRYVLDEFDDRYLFTLGAKITKREMALEYPDLDLEVDVKVLIYDIIGEPGFRRLLREAYFEGAKGLMAVCDVTRGDTLDSLEDWIESAFGVAGEIPIYVMANKVDLEDDVVVSESEVNSLSGSYHSPWDFTSAKTGENVEKIFEQISEKLVNKAVGQRYGTP